MREGSRSSRIEKQAHLLMLTQRERHQICIQSIRSDERVDHIGGNLAFRLQDLRQVDSWLGCNPFLQEVTMELINDQRRHPVIFQEGSVLRKEPTSRKVDKCGTV